MTEGDAFLLTAPREHEEGDDSQQHTCPLPHIQPFPINEDSTDKHQHGTCGIYRPIDSQRHTFHSEIAAYPRREDDDTLEDYPFMNLPTATGHMEDTSVEHGGGIRQYYQRYEDERAEESVEKEHRGHGVVLKCLFLKGIIKSQQSR